MPVFYGQYNHFWKNGDAFLSQSTGACFKSSPNILDRRNNPVDPVVSALRKKIRKQQGKRKLIEDSTLPHTKTPQLRLHTNPLLLVEACVDRCVDCVDWWEKSLSAQTPNPQRPLECFEHFEVGLGVTNALNFLPPAYYRFKLTSRYMIYSNGLI